MGMSSVAKMLRFVVLLAFLFASSSAQDASKIVDDMIVRTNSFIVRKGINKVDLPEVENKSWFVRKFLSSGTIRDLASIQRIGNATLEASTIGTLTKYTIHATVGLDSLVVEYDYLFQYLWFFKTSGRMIVTTKKNSVIADSLVITDSKTGSCSLIVKDAAVQDLADFQVSIKGAGLFRIFIEAIVKSAIRYFVPNLIMIVNSELEDFFKNYPMINEELTKYVCHHFQ